MKLAKKYEDYICNKCSSQFFTWKGFGGWKCNHCGTTRSTTPNFVIKPPQLPQLKQIKYNRYNKHQLIFDFLSHSIIVDIREVKFILNAMMVSGNKIVHIHSHSKRYLRNHIIIKGKQPYQMSINKDSAIDPNKLFEDIQRVLNYQMEYKAWKEGRDD